MKIYFAGDHAGFELKGKLIDFVRSLGYEVEDVGPHTYEAGDDYVDYVVPLARAVSGKPSGEARGIVVAGSGQGEIIAMNRIPGVRAALLCACPRTNPDGRVGAGACNLELIKASRDHNDSNILAIGARFASEDEAKRAVKLWLETPFSNEERHVRRLRKIDRIA